MKDRKKTDERGMITVEAVLSLVPFILVILGIISFINIFAVHNKVQFAIYQAGNELASYTYIYEALGIRSADIALGKDIDRETEEIDDVIDKTTVFLGQVESLSLDTAGEVVESGKSAVNAGVDLITDPEDLVRNLVYYGIETAEESLKGVIIDMISSALVPVYLDASMSKSNPMSADEYLKWMGVVDGVKGLEFNNSEIFVDPEYKMIDIVVEYDIEIDSFKLFFKSPKVHVVQRCAVPAWLDGDGVHYEE